MPKLHQIIERHWQRPNPFLSFLLKPLSKLFAKLAAKRRDDFVSGRLKSEKLPVPVVVVGNADCRRAGIGFAGKRRQGRHHQPGLRAQE